MRKTAANYEDAAKKALRGCLDRVPFVKVKAIERAKPIGEIRPDLRASITVPDGKRELLVEIKSSGEPRIARSAVEQLLLYRNAVPGAYGIFMAPYIAPKSAQICTDAGVGYVDFVGNCRLSFGQIYLEQQGMPNTLAKKRDLRSLYSPKAARILRVLLRSPQESWKVQDLAEEAKVSLGQVSKVKKLLADRELIREATVGFSLSGPEELLKDWAQNYTYKKTRIRSFYSLWKIPQIEENLARLCGEKGVRYALTGFSAAARLAPAVRYARAFAYVEETRQDVASLLEFKEVPSGANVSLLTPLDEGVFYGVEDIDRVRITSPVQAYLDLVGFRGRGEEAADALLREVIRKRWRVAGNTPPTKSGQQGPF